MRRGIQLMPKKWMGPFGPCPAITTGATVQEEGTPSPRLQIEIPCCTAVPSNLSPLSLPGTVHVIPCLLVLGVEWLLLAWLPSHGVLTSFRHTLKSILMAFHLILWTLRHLFHILCHLVWLDQIQ